MRDYILEKYKNRDTLAITGSSDGGGGGTTPNVNQANADRLSAEFARMLPPLANDLLLSSAELTASDMVSEGPIEGFVNNEGLPCPPLEATFLDGTAVAEPSSKKITKQDLIFEKLDGVRSDYKSFVSGELDGYISYLNSRFVHKEPIVISNWIQGRSDINGDYDSAINTYRGGKVGPLQTSDNILNCTPTALKSTIMRWGPGAKGAGGGTDTSEMALAPNEMLYRYAGAGFRKTPYSYRKIYHPNSVINRDDYTSPSYDYVFSEDQPVLYQGSYDFGCSITERGFLNRSFCSRAFFKFIAEPTSSNGDYSNHQKFCATAVRLTGIYDSKFPNGKPGKYTYSLAAQAEPEGLKEPLIDDVVSSINSMGLDYWKPIRFHESYYQLNRSSTSIDVPEDHHSRARRAGKYNKTPKDFSYISGGATQTRKIDDGIVTYNTWNSKRIYVEKDENETDVNGNVIPRTNQNAGNDVMSAGGLPKLVRNIPLVTPQRVHLFSEKLIVMDQTAGSTDTRAYLQEGSLVGVSGNVQRWYKPNKTYRITGSLYFPNDNVKVDSFNFYLVGDSSQGIGGQSIATVGPFKDNNWRDFDFEFTNSGDGNFRKMRFNLKNGNDSTGLTQTGDFIGIKDFTVLEKTLKNEEPGKDPRIAYMNFKAQDFLGTGVTIQGNSYPFNMSPFEKSSEISFALNNVPFDVGDSNALKFLFPKITDFELSTKNIKESITLRTVTNETASCGTKNNDDMKFPFVTGATNSPTIGFQLSEALTNEIEGAFLWPVWLGDDLDPVNNFGSTSSIDTGKLFIDLIEGEDIGFNGVLTSDFYESSKFSKLQSGIEKGYDVFGVITEPPPPFGTPVEFRLEMGSLAGTTQDYGILATNGTSDPHVMEGVYIKTGIDAYYSRHADTDSNLSNSLIDNQRNAWVRVRSQSEGIDTTIDISTPYGATNFVGLKNGVFHDVDGTSLPSTGRNTNNSAFYSEGGTWKCIFDGAIDSTRFDYYPYDYFDSYDDFGWVAMKGDEYDTSSSTSTSYENDDYDNPWEVPSWKFQGLFAAVASYYGPQGKSVNVCPNDTPGGQGGGVLPGGAPQPGCAYAPTMNSPYYYSYANQRRVTPVGHPFDPKSGNFKDFRDELGRTGDLVDGTIVGRRTSIPTRKIIYLHAANPNLGAPSANVTGKPLSISLKESLPTAFNFNNFKIDYSLGEEDQKPLSNESVTTTEYNKNIYGPNEIYRAGSAVGAAGGAVADVTLSRFDYGTGPLTHRGATYYRWRVSSVNITNGGANYSDNVTLNFNSNLQTYVDPNPTVNVSNGVVQSVSFANTAAKGQFEGSGFIFGNYSAHTYGHLSPVVTATVVDENDGEVVAGDLSLNLTGDNTDYNYGMRKYSAIDGTASTDIESDGTYQSDWMENIPLDADIVPLIHAITRREVDCVKITLIIESLYQQLIQGQDPLAGATIKRDGLDINFSVLTYFDGVPESIYPKKETKINFFGTVTTFYAVDTEEIALPSYSEILTAYPNEDYKSLSVKYPRVVEVRKNDFETNSVRMSRDARVFQVVEVIKQSFKYPFSAIMKSSVDARTFREPPNKQWRLRLKKVLVPSNYYPLDIDGSDKRFVKDANRVGTRIVYDGNWDGTFKTAWTDNPAWILYDLLINQRYGIGNRIDDLQDINIFNLYKIGRYCDSVNDNGEFVGLDDGVGGLEPRFSCNIMLTASQNAFQTISDICTVFNGMAFWVNGRLDFFADQPKEPMTFFNNENVFDGIFNYTTTNKSSLFNVAEVTFLDKRDDFSAKKEIVMDEDSMRQNGVIRRDINGKGCTSRAQAARLGRYILYTNKLEREIVNFKSSSESLMLSIGDVIEIQDELKNFEVSYGKILEIEAGSVTIEDKPNVNSILTNPSGAFVVTPTGQDQLTELYDQVLAGGFITNNTLDNLYDPQAVKLEVTGAIRVDNKIKIGVADPNFRLNLVPTGTLINLDLQNRNTHQYRVLTIKPEEDNLYSITATEYKKEKFNLIETKEDFKIDEEDSYNVGIPNNTTKPLSEPSGFGAQTVLVNSREQNIQFNITGYATGNETAYQLTVISPNGKVDTQIVPKSETLALAGPSSNNYYVTKGEVKDLNSYGTYNFEVKSISSKEIFGTPSSIDFTSPQTTFSPSSLDTDGDGLTDYEENVIYGTNPNNTDTDFDGLSDYDEINTHGTNPLNRNTDGDLIDDGGELTIGTDPLTFNDPSEFYPLITGFRIKDTIRQSGVVELAFAKGAYTIHGILPNVNGLYQLSGTINGKTAWAGARDYPRVAGDTANYISNNNPYKNVHNPGSGMVTYDSTSGHWRIETNQTFASAYFRNVQLWTGGSNAGYPWEVTDWKQVSMVDSDGDGAPDYESVLDETSDSTTLSAAGAASLPTIFFTYTQDGTVIDLS